MNKTLLSAIVGILTMIAPIGAIGPAFAQDADEDEDAFEEDDFDADEDDFDADEDDFDADEDDFDADEDDFDADEDDFDADEDAFEIGSDEDCAFEDADCVEVCVVEDGEGLLETDDADCDDFDALCDDGLELDADDADCADGEGCDVDGSDDDECVVEVTLLIRDTDGAAVAWAYILVVDLEDGEPVDEGTTDEAGTWILDLEPGHYRMHVSPDEEDDDVLPTRGDFVVEAEPEEQSVQLVLFDASLFEGRVLDATGRGIPGVYVYTVELPLDEEHLEHCLDVADEADDEEEIVDEICVFDFGEDVTDEEGRFRLGGLFGEASYAVFVDSGDDDIDDVHLEDLWLGDAEEVDLGDIVLSEGASVTGRLVDPAGAPLAGYAWTVDADGDVLWSEAEADGTFEIGGLDAGTYEIWVEAEDETLPYLPKVTAVTVGAEEAKPLGDVALGAGSTVTGNVTLGGKPVAGAVVVFWTEDFGTEATTAPSGAYVLAGLPPGAYSVYIEAPDGAADGWIDGSAADAPRVVAGGDLDYGILLEAPGLLQGVVRDAQGKPVGGATITVWSEDDDAGEATSGPDGRYSIELPADGYVIVVDAPKAAPYYLWDEVEVREGSTTVHDVTLKTEGVALAGKVTMDGKPIGDVGVLVVGMVRGEVVFVELATTDKAGSYKIGFVPPGEYDVVVSKGVKETSAKVTVGASAVDVPVLALQGGK